ncbi:nuclear transport factor 2 family protein [Bacillus sp. OK048]|uniref:nuclear transport factor 2 family protein n=1 Tax=Bacillus sp. OK048 TaxID=1882761 RepID=UPI0008871632|nr:nuclear transport factor 2 family protein [Bacillus sp. OK048]SDL97879.1 SnoaL-like domain-containing protein [Bacillus sp. OK048]
MKTVSDKNQELIKRYYALLDSNKLDESMEYFSENAVLKFNSETINGREGISSALGGIVSSVNGIRHVLTNVWEVEEDLIFLECDVIYSRKDNQQIVVKAAAINEIENGMIKEQRIYVDLSPVFA